MGFIKEIDAAAAQVFLNLYQQVASILPSPEEIPLVMYLYVVRTPGCVIFRCYACVESGKKSLRKYIA